MQLYALVRAGQERDKSVTIIGNVQPFSADSEIAALVAESDRKLREICRCTTYDEYQEMGKCSLTCYTQAAAKKAATAFAKRLSVPLLSLPISYQTDEEREKAQAERALRDEAAQCAGWDIVIDYTATPRPLSLALLLLESGFCVRTVIADAFVQEDRSAFERLSQAYPGMSIASATDPVFGMTRKPSRASGLLAIGQKAAFHCNTNHFVNIVEGGGLYGFSGLQALVRLIEEARTKEKTDMRTLVQIKGLGCGR
jgi:hypothetical protein